MSAKSEKNECQGYEKYKLQNNMKRYLLFTAKKISSTKQRYTIMKLFKYQSQLGENTPQKLNTLKYNELKDLLWEHLYTGLVEEISFPSETLNHYHQNGRKHFDFLIDIQDISGPLQKVISKRFQTLHSR